MVKKNFKKVVKILSSKELRILPAYLSYSFLLACIPLFTVVIIIAGVFSISINSIIDLLNQILPSYVSNTIINAISVKNFDLSLGFLNVITLLGATKGMYAIINTSNNLYKIENNSSIKDALKAILILFIFIIIIIFLIIVPVFGDKIINFLNNYKIFETTIESIIIIYKIIKWPLSFLIVFFSVKIIYIIAPSTKVKGTETTLGAFFTTIMWGLFSLLFSYYLIYFGKYDIIYGGLANITIFLIWLYVLCYIFILGMIINVIEYNKK